MSGIRSIVRNPTVKGSATGASAPIYVDSDDNKLKMIPAGSGTTEVELVDASTAQTLSNKTFVAPVLGAATGTSLLLSGSAAASGYATGAGGAVTQATNSATAVVLSKPCGQITTVALTTAAAAEERFTVTNTLVAATDCIALGTTYNGQGTPAVSVVNVAAGAFDIVITNLHATLALNAAMVINFAVIKAVAA